MSQLIGLWPLIGVLAENHHHNFGFLCGSIRWPIVAVAAVIHQSATMPRPPRHAKITSPEIGTGFIETPSLQADHYCCTLALIRLLRTAQPTPARANVEISTTSRPPRPNVFWIVPLLDAQLTAYDQPGGSRRTSADRYPLIRSWAKA